MAHRARKANVSRWEASGRCCDSKCRVAFQRTWQGQAEMQFSCESNDDEVVSPREITSRRPIMRDPCASMRNESTRLLSFVQFLPKTLNRQEKTTISMDRIVWDRLLLIEVRCCNICLQCFECNEKIKNEDKSNERCKLMKIFNIMFLKLI